MNTSSQQITQLYLFHFKKHRFWAFSQMGLGYRHLVDVSGLSFVKLLGTGGGSGFSLRPDFSTYGLLLVWKNADFARAFEDNILLKAYKERAFSYRKLGLQNYKSQGLWSGQQPFEAGTAMRPDAPVAIITRATLRWNRLWSFWRNVPKASRSIEAAKGVTFFKGIGEWPFIQQATISLWIHQEAVMEFAYRQKAHAEIVKKTRQKKWYAEDLFARFHVLDEETHSR